LRETFFQIKESGKRNVAVTTWRRGRHIHHAQEKLGFLPKTPLEIGIPKFVKWYRENQELTEIANDREVIADKSGMNSGNDIP
jgi:nucleoside-diphosphate-sugar epimerase